jgi:hypothetical protein
MTPNTQQPTLDTEEEWRVGRGGGLEIYRVYDSEGRLIAKTRYSHDAAQIVSDHNAAKSQALLVEALRFQRIALVDLITDFGVDGHPRLHASLANMRDDIDAALKAAGVEEK